MNSDASQRFIELALKRSQEGYWRHMALLFQALFISGPAFTLYDDHRHAKRGHRRRMAQHGRARAIVLFDRVLCGEYTRMELPDA